MSQPTASETIERPMPGTLARGRYESTPAKIWVITGVGAVLALAYLLFRVRQLRRSRTAKLEKALALPASQTSRA